MDVFFLDFSLLQVSSLMLIANCQNIFYPLCANYFSIKRVDMRDYNINLQDNYVDLQHNYVENQANCNQITIIQNLKKYI